MKRNRHTTPPAPENWGMGTDASGELSLNGVRLTDLAATHGTPLQVVNEDGLFASASGFRETVARHCGTGGQVHFAMKCNSVPAIIRIMLRAGLSLEAVTDYELELALQGGCPAGKIIVNGPAKSPELLRRSIALGLRFIVVDSLEELADIADIARQTGGTATVVLRVNPDFTPRGMNQGSATASRRGSAFGLDLKGGEVQAALLLLRRMKDLRFHGFHLHIGTGIQYAEDYRNALSCLPALIGLADQAEETIRVLDVGGGYATPHSRELTGREMLLYQVFGRLHASSTPAASPDEFVRVIHQTISGYFEDRPMPNIVFEPGRCICSGHELLLLTVGRVKERRGCGKWLITDGGLGTVTLPTFYEHHEILLCNDARRPLREYVTITGPGCFSGDVVYRNKLMPEVHAGEVLAVMDTGAYFTALESSFGFPRCAIAVIQNGSARILRRRETFADMISRDVCSTILPNERREVTYGICRSA